MDIRSGRSIILSRMTHYTCRICKSEKRKEIEQLIKEKAVIREIANKYLMFFDCDLHLLEQSIANHRKHIPRELTQDEEELLERFAKGDVDIDEMSRIVAVRVFKKILANPDDVKFIDFFRAELLRMKQEEAKNSDSWGKELVFRLFAGMLPPRECPNCGAYIWGKELEDEDNPKKEYIEDSESALN